MPLYRSRQGDMLDRICLEYFGYSSGAVATLLQHNPGLAALGSVYKAGIIIELPELKATVTNRWCATVGLSGKFNGE